MTTYNRPDALNRVLESLSEMTDAADEVIVADDGSGAETAQVIQCWIHALPLRHVWQEDLGFRAAEARNKAVLASTGDYLIFLDGDCMVPRDFVSEHRRLAEPGYLVSGNRILFSTALTDAVIQGSQRPNSWRWSDWISHKIQRKVNRLLPLLRLSDGSWRKRRLNRWQGVHTCNLGVWRANFEAVNGFDQSFQGWGHEDADLTIRLMRYGVGRKDGACAVPVYHLWHRENDRSREAVNQHRLIRVLKGDSPVRCQVGLLHDFP